MAEKPEEKKTKKPGLLARAVKEAASVAGQLKDERAERIDQNIETLRQVTSAKDNETTRGQVLRHVNPSRGTNRRA